MLDVGRPSLHSWFSLTCEEFASAFAEAEDRSHQKPAQLFPKEDEPRLFPNDWNQQILWTHQYQQC